MLLAVLWPSEVRRDRLKSFDCLIARCDLLISRNIEENNTTIKYFNYFFRVFMTFLKIFVNLVEMNWYNDVILFVKVYINTQTMNENEFQLSLTSNNMRKPAKGKK